MRLMRLGPPGGERPALLDDEGRRRDLSGLVPDLAGAALSPEGLAAIAAADPRSLPELPVDLRVGPPVARPGKIVCSGLNYADHAAEFGVDVPKEPVLFLKASSAQSGPFDDILMPPGAERVDWEVELALVIGRGGRMIERDAAPEHVAGFMVMNDVSERNFQIERSGQWTKGKSADTFAPMGPWLVTPDELGDPQALAIWTDVDGQRMQEGSTATMVFAAYDIVAYVSQFMSLEAGDVIATGTPPGVGMGHRPPVYLSEGQVVRCGIEGLGEQACRARMLASARAV